MKALTITVACVLLCTGLVAGEIHQISPVILDTPENSVCPLDGQLEAARNNISNNFTEALVDYVANITNTYVIPACGGSGWRRVGFLDMSNPAQTCPEQWRLYEEDTVRACGRQTSGGGSCDSVTFNNSGISYTQVCGRVTGYQYASPDASHGSNHEMINGVYLDGVSITYGNPRQHIWSLFAVWSYIQCCNDHLSNVESYNFIGNNTFCDTGNNVSGLQEWARELYTSYPLWDGSTQCANNPNCCAPYPGPWFHTILASPSTSYIEVRICGSQGTHDEDTPVGLVEIYINN